MNIVNPDCEFNIKRAIEFNEAKVSEFVDVTVDDLEDEVAWDLKNITNARLTYASGTAAAAEITDFVNMVDGKHYRLLVKNAANTALGVTFPSGTILEKIDIAATSSGSDTITLAQKALTNGDYVLYDFFTDGEAVFVKRSIYS